MIDTLAINPNNNASEAAQREEEIQQARANRQEEAARAEAEREEAAQERQRQQEQIENLKEEEGQGTVISEVV